MFVVVSTILSVSNATPCPTAATGAAVWRPRDDDTTGYSAIFELKHICDDCDTEDKAIQFSIKRNKVGKDLNDLLPKDPSKIRLIAETAGLCTRPTVANPTPTPNCDTLFGTDKKKNEISGFRPTGLNSVFHVPPTTRATLQYKETSYNIKASPLLPPVATTLCQSTTPVLTWKCNQIPDGSAANPITPDPLDRTKYLKGKARCTSKDSAGVTQSCLVGPFKHWHGDSYHLESSKITTVHGDDTPANRCNFHF